MGRTKAANAGVRRTTAKGLDLARRLEAALLIAPLRDDEINGFELTCIAAADARLEATRVLLTAPDLPGSEASFLGARGVDLLHFPAAPDEIGRAVSRSLSRSS